METYNDWLAHHGILGQKWGERNGPPYPLSGGDYSESEKKALKAKRINKNSLYNKRHYDSVLTPEKTLTTLSYDKNRTKNTDMFYAAYDYFDKHQYNTLFNRPIPTEVRDKDGRIIGTGQMYKYRIDNKIKHNMKVASEDSSAEAFRKLYSKDRDFYNFVNDSERMQKYFIDDKYKFKGYREARSVLNKMKDENYTPSDKDLQVVYRMFNYVLPYDGGGSDPRGAHDVQVQRAKFFKEMKKEGYGAVLDTNDALYGAFKATAPVIVFDMSNIIPDKARSTNVGDKYFSSVMLIGKKFLGL